MSKPIYGPVIIAAGLQKSLMQRLHDNSRRPPTSESMALRMRQARQAQ
jgi:hypothetical protein